MTLRDAASGWTRRPYFLRGQLKSAVASVPRTTTRRHGSAWPKTVSFHMAHRDLRGDGIAMNHEPSTNKRIPSPRLGLYAFPTNDWFPSDWKM